VKGRKEGKKIKRVRGIVGRKKFFYFTKKKKKKNNLVSLYMK
jgi:hypothetical protein